MSKNEEVGFASALRAGADRRPLTAGGLSTTECTEDGCTTPVVEVPENRCGGAVHGGAQGCGELFCGKHLFHTCQYGDLCTADYSHVSDHPASECCGIND